MKVAPVNALHNRPRTGASPDREGQRPPPRIVPGILPGVSNETVTWQRVYSTILVIDSSRMSVAPMLFSLGMSTLTTFFSTTLSTA